MRKKQKIVILMCVLLLFACVAVYNYKVKHMEYIEATTWDLLDNMDSNAVWIEGRTERDDYPYGYNVGQIEDEEIKKGVLITPGTSVNINGVVTAESPFLSLSYKIHPWVANESDGAYLNVDILSEEQKHQSYICDVNFKLQKQIISLNDFIGCNNLEIKIYVTNQEGKNEDCDWVVMEECAIGGFKEKPIRFLETGYIKSATYFGDEWAINFWNSEMDNIDDDFKQIKKDGFNSIILCIPWREFQTETSPIKYNEYALKKLNEVMEKATVADLGVYVRIGYLWDYYDDQEDMIVDRYCALMGDMALQQAWNDYVEKMYTTLSAYQAFKGGFITWEDFYNNLGVCDEPDEKKRIEKASFIGYQKYVKDNYTLREYNDNCKSSYSSFEEIPIPKRNESAMEVMYAFYDNFLNNLLEESQKKFPDLSMEVRMDWDVFYRNDGSMDYYKHTDTFSCMNATVTTTMYGIPMGFQNIGERVGYVVAMEKTEYILQQFKLQNGNKPVYIDQFIFADNTPAFKNNAQIKENELNDYLKNISDVLLNYSEGYGIWTYRNYCSNMLYNSQFALKDDGWKCNEKVLFEEEENTIVCRLENGGSISQIVPEVRNHFDNDEYIFEFEVTKVDKPGEVFITFGDERQLLEVSKEGKFKLSFNKNSAFDISLESNNCQVSIDNLKLYSQVQQGFLYDQDNNELQCVEGIRVLNEKLQ